MGLFLGPIAIKKVSLGATEVVKASVGPVEAYEGGDTPVLHPVEMGDFSYTMSGTEATITGYTGSNTELTVPNI